MLGRFTPREHIKMALLLIHLWTEVKARCFIGVLKVKGHSGDVGNDSADAVSKKGCPV